MIIAIFKIIIYFFINLFLGLFSISTVIRCLINKNNKNFAKKSFVDNSILVISPDSKLGDNIINLHFLFLLRLNFPTSYIAVIHNINTINIYKSCSFINEFIPIKINHESKRLFLNRYSVCKDIIENAIGDRLFSISIIPRWDEDLYSPFLSWFSFSPRRFAFSNSVTLRKRIRNLFTDFLLTDISYNKECVHEFERPYFLIKMILDGKEPLITSPRLIYWDLFSGSSSSYLLPKKVLESSANIASIAVGAGNGKRKWPLQSYVDLISKIDKKNDFIFLLFGSKSEFLENEFIRENCSNSDIINLAGQLTISELSLALTYSQLLICNDSGILHIASLVGVPVLEFSTHPIGASSSHPNSPARFGPYGNDSMVLRPLKPKSIICTYGCIFSKPHCITSISVDYAYEKFLLLFSNLKNKLGARN